MSVGHVQAPSSLELWWDKNKKSTYTTLVLAAVALAGFYGFKIWRRSQVDATWSRFAAVTGLREGYAGPNDFADIARQNTQFQNYYIGEEQSRLITKLTAHLKDASAAELDAAIAAADKSTKPLYLWVAAQRAFLERDWDTARRRAGELKSGFPTHFLCTVSEYPPQYRSSVEDEAKKEPETKPETKPELEPPVKGSPVDLLLARIEREVAFESNHPEYYVAPEPDGAQVRIKTSVGEFTIGLYESRAPRHVASFIDKAKAGYFDGIAVDQISREGESNTFRTAVAEEFHFGLEITKEEQDRTKWVEARGKKDVEGVIDFEESGVSHFPGMVAAEPGVEGKSIPFRIYINANDAAETKDGTRVVFGRVVEGMDVVEQIVSAPLSTEDERRAGTGTPRDSITIESVTIQDR